MSGTRKRATILLLLILALIVLAVPSAGCAAKKGSSGLTFYEFFDPT